MGIPKTWHFLFDRALLRWLCLAQTRGLVTVPHPCESTSAACVSPATSVGGIPSAWLSLLRDLGEPGASECGDVGRADVLSSRLSHSEI